MNMLLTQHAKFNRTHLNSMLLGLTIISALGCQKPGPPSLASLIGKSRTEIDAVLGAPVTSSEKKRLSFATGKAEVIVLTSCSYPIPASKQTLNISYTGTEFTGMAIQMEYPVNSWKQALTDLGIPVTSSIKLDKAGNLGPIPSIVPYTAQWQADSKDKGAKWSLSIVKEGKKLVKN